jgi:uncharacterized RDD family membrane protein YckC
VPSTDKLTIDTPEQITLELPLAGIGSRFLAFAFDTLLQWVGFFLIFLMFAVGVGVMRPLSVLNWLPGYIVAPLLILLFFCLYWGYFAFFEILWSGQTPGKRLVRIRVMKDTGRPLNAFEVIGRNLMRAVDMLPGTYTVALISMMISSQNRRLGDYVAGSVVVHDQQMQTIRPDWTVSNERREVRPEATMVSADELVLIETYLQRRYELEPAIRQAHVRQIAAVISTRTGLRPADNQSADDFLEAVARDVRDSARLRSS